MTLDLVGLTQDAALILLLLLLLLLFPLLLMLLLLSELVYAAKSMYALHDLYGQAKKINKCYFGQEVNYVFISLGTIFKDSELPI